MKPVTNDVVATVLLALAVASAVVSDGSNWLLIVGSFACVGGAIILRLLDECGYPTRG